MSEALRLADDLESDDFHNLVWSRSEVADELRRLAGVEAEYLKLKESKEVECQYSKDAGMTEHKCAGKCQYEALARAVMSDNTGKA
jgi:hypothetical protein